MVKMYTCGPTVYRDAHIGNLRSYLMADWIRRALEAQGLTVKHIKNITDVGHMRQEVLEQGEDKVIAAAIAEGKTPAEIAQFYTDRFLRDERKLNIWPADHFPKATDHIDEMIAIVQRLVDKGHAYEVQGNVYFDIASFPRYGQLSGNLQQAELMDAIRVEADPLKRDPRDFTLWKAAEPGRELKWPRPVGRRFPGMAYRVLGHVDQVPERAIRPPHRWSRQHFSPPRRGNRPERGLYREAGGRYVGPRPAPSRRRCEDGQVDGQLVYPRRHRVPRHRSPGLALPLPHRQVQDPTQFHLHLAQGGTEGGSSGSRTGSGSGQRYPRRPTATARRWKSGNTDSWSGSTTIWTCLALWP